MVEFTLTFENPDGGILSGKFSETFDPSLLSLAGYSGFEYNYIWNSESMASGRRRGTDPAANTRGREPQANPIP